MINLVQFGLNDSNRLVCHLTTRWQWLNFFKNYPKLNPHPSIGVLLIFFFGGVRTFAPSSSLPIGSLISYIH